MNINVDGGVVLSMGCQVEAFNLQITNCISLHLNLQPIVLRGHIPPPPYGTPHTAPSAVVVFKLRWIALTGCSASCSPVLGAMSDPPHHLARVDFKISRLSSTSLLSCGVSSPCSVRSNTNLCYLPVHKFDSGCSYHALHALAEKVD